MITQKKKTKTSNPLADIFADHKIYEIKKKTPKRTNNIIQFTVDLLASLYSVWGYIIINMNTDQNIHIVL